MTCVHDRHDNALRSFTDMPLPMNDNLSHRTSCVDVIARETDACEPCMAMLIDTESVDEPDFQELETDVLFHDASDMFEDDSVLQTPMYAHGESAMIVDSASDLDVLSRELLSIGVMSTGLAHEGIAHGGEQEVDTLLHVWLDAMSGSDAQTVFGTDASLIEHESSTRLPLLRRLSEFDRHLEPVDIGLLTFLGYEWGKLLEIQRFTSLALCLMECVASLSSPPPSCSLQSSSPYKGASLLHTHRTCCALMKSFVCLTHLDKEAAFAKLVEMNPKINDENWQRERRRESEELRMRREQEDKEEAQKTENYREISKRMEGYDEEAVKEAKALVVSFIKAGEKVEEKIQEAADNGQLKKLVLIVIYNRLELARHDNERHIVQALDLLYRRIEAEILRREATPSIQFLDELLNLQDGCSHEDWLRRCRQSMIETFPREDALSFLAPSGFDLRNVSIFLFRQGAKYCTELLGQVIVIFK
ncbi:hypothetical protein L7F22_045009 [Adiantum nelumboides]|nr:hypothetical protein [Adiantum nelumboides]